MVSKAEKDIKGILNASLWCITDKDFVGDIYTVT